MQNRSWLCVPGESEGKLGKAATSGADVIVVDLADATDSADRQAVRRRTVEWLNIHRRQITESRRMGRWVRIAALDGHLWREDLLAALQGGADGIVLPRAAGPEAVRQLAAELYELEQAYQVPTGSTLILPVVGETAQSAMTLAAWLDASFPRLAGLTWCAPALAAATGASRVRDARNGWSDVCRLVRAQLLLVARSRGIAAIESFHGSHDDEKGLKAAADDARADGFTGMLAIHPVQVQVINAAFSPAGTGSAAAPSLIEQGQARPARRLAGMNADPAKGPMRTPILRSA